MIAELDESDGSFLGLSAHRAIITNIDAEHLDHYSNYAGVIGAFQRFIRQVEEPPVVCIDDPGVRELLEGTTRPVIRYSLSDPSADYLAAEIDVSNQDSRFVVVRDGERLGTVILPARGRHNIGNAIGAIAMAIETGVDPKVSCEALSEYRGVQRRFTIRSAPAGFLIVDDYGHPPSEINATLAVGREWADERNGRLIVVFQPHRFTRTAALTQRFGGAFSDADQVIVTGIYAAGEKPIDGVTGQLIADSVRESGQVSIEYVERRDAVAARLAPTLQTGDVVLTLGAGDVWRVGDELEERIEADAVASASPLMEKREGTTGRETI